jgi:hypothetical protein
LQVEGIAWVRTGQQGVKAKGQNFHSLQNSDRGIFLDKSKKKMQINARPKSADAITPKMIQ